MNYGKQVILFHLLLIVPLLLIVGVRIVQKKQITEIEGVLLLMIAMIAGGRHLQLFFKK